ncbi:hypothetical protein M758_1G282400 [Ceratodon purpureus]|nr:hypothetical protein M758_1G282400 [Ceratodon purpureus]
MLPWIADTNERANKIDEYGVKFLISQLPSGANHKIREAQLVQYLSGAGREKWNDEGHSLVFSVALSSGTLECLLQHIRFRAYMTSRDEIEIGDMCGMKLERCFLNTIQLPRN